MGWDGGVVFVRGRFAKPDERHFWGGRSSNVKLLNDGAEFTANAIGEIERIESARIE